MYVSVKSLYICSYVCMYVRICMYIKTHDSESRGQEEAAVHDE